MFDQRLCCNFRVACNMMYPNETVTPELMRTRDYRGFLDNYEMPIIMADVQCNGSESSLSECRYQRGQYCGHYSDVLLNCRSGPPRGKSISESLCYWSILSQWFFNLFLYHTFYYIHTYMLYCWFHKPIFINSLNSCRGQPKLPVWHPSFGLIQNLTTTD